MYEDGLSWCLTCNKKKMEFLVNLGICVDIGSTKIDKIVNEFYSFASENNFICSFLDRNI